MSMKRVGAVVGALLAAVLVAAPVAAQTKPKIRDTGLETVASAIFIGNSFFYYNNGIHGHLSQLLRSADAAAKLRLTMVTISGSGADWHDVASYFRPDAIGKYSFDAGNNIVFTKLDKLFDVAIMMDCSQCPIHPQLRTVFFDYAAKHSATVRKSGAVPVFFMSWAYADKPEMTEELAEAYTQAGNDNDALVIPAGLAFARAVKQLPEVNLYAADKRHPSLAGTYLAASTVYATILKKSPVGLAYTAGLDAATAKALQTIAWETVQEYLGTAVSSR
jgi:archaellin